MEGKEVIIHQQDEIRVFINMLGGITIERVDDYGDICNIAISYRFIDEFIKKIRELKERDKGWEMSRWIRIQVDIMSHELFGDTPYSEREAWIWILTRAAWKDTSHRVGSSMRTVKRGSFFCTIRQLQDAWKWRSTRQVHDFLSMLKAETMIETRTETGKTLLSVCNYDKYQSDYMENETQIETPFETNLKQKRNTKDTNTPIIPSLRSGISAPARNKPTVQSKLMETLNEEIAKAVIEHRKAMKRPLTVRAAELLGKAFAAAPNTCGLTPEQAADLMIYKGWQGFEPEWAKNAIKSGYSANSKPKETVKPDSELSEEVLEAEWKKRLDYARRNRTWFTAAWGEMPSKEGCRVPEHLLQPNDGKHPHGGNWIEQ